ncbi:phage virion morphogenesis protein [Pseudomonas mediterranea]|uniref:phage virion morphogenesis protein n=1 Tax=Pseudomonas mediterranea TaxID=183795 RepID=UPI0009EC8F5D|nr:phage virion morphogenesis protein [Pseudomonas mediterranea]
MTSRLEALEDWAAGLLSQLQPAARNTLARNIGQALRRSQQQRIISQRNPDGSMYAPRKQRNLRGEQGRVKRKVQMFQKLRTTRLLKAYGDGNAVRVGFLGRVARIARIHQFGLKEHAEGRHPRIKYSQREVLGFREQDLDLIRHQLVSHLISP